MSDKDSDKTLCELDVKAWAVLSEKIRRRDNFRCQATCGCTAKLTVHHVIPRTENGSDDPANLITLCTKCHDEIENTTIRTLAEIYTYDADWHSTASWWPTKAELTPRCATKPQKPKKKQAPARELKPAVMCKKCGKEFHPLTVRSVFCSYRCGRDYQNARRHAQAGLSSMTPEEHLSELRQSSPDVDSPPVQESAKAIVASPLQPVESNEYADQHSYDSLRLALARRQKSSLRKFARELGFDEKDAGALSDLLRGRYDHVSLETANRWTQALGLPMIPMKVPVAVCPSCLVLGIREVHAAGDCHGAPVASVVCLAPGQVVAAAPAPTRPKRPDKRVVIHAPREALDLLRKLRQADTSDGMTLLRILREHDEDHVADAGEVVQ